MSDYSERYAAEIRKLAPEAEIIVLDTTGSTNKEAKRLAEAGAKEGTAVLTCRQTEGRGRLGRSFFSPEGGIYLSLILRPELEPQSALLITVAAAVAAAEAIESAGGGECGIKWVNDIFIAGKKVCGILTEGAFGEDGSLKYAVLGVGINASAPVGGFPPELAGIAGSVFEETDVSAEQKAEIAGKFIKAFFGYYREIKTRSFMGKYRNRSVLTGKRVSFVKDGTEHTAIVTGIDDSAALILDENGQTIRLAAGEVSVRTEKI